LNRWLVLTEGKSVGLFDPLDLVRPPFMLRDGAWTVAERWIELLQPTVVVAAVRPWLAAAVAEATAWHLNRVPAGDTPDDVWILNGLVNPAEDPRWNNLSLPPLFTWSEGETQVMRLPSTAFAGVLPGLRPWIESGAQSAIPVSPVPPTASLPLQAPSGPWHLVNGLNKRLLFDWQLWNRSALRRVSAEHDPEAEGRLGIVVLGEESVWRGRDVLLHPHVVIDARSGPVWLDDGVEIESFARIDGPAYIGAGTSLLGGKLTGGGVLGPGCKIGGEWEAAIAQGFANKAHAGFFGHGILGEWVNLGAMTTNSDLKNTYGTVRVERQGIGVETGLMKVGSYLADHTKTGIGTLIPTGAAWGVGVNLFGGGLGPKSIPSFIWGDPGALTEHHLDRMLTTADVAVSRRAGMLERIGRPAKLTEPQSQVLRTVFERTARMRADFLSRRSSGHSTRG